MEVILGFKWDEISRLSGEVRCLADVGCRSWSEAVGCPGMRRGGKCRVGVVLLFRYMGEDEEWRRMEEIVCSVIVRGSYYRTM